MKFERMTFTWFFSPSSENQILYISHYNLNVFYSESTEKDWIAGQAYTYDILKHIKYNCI